MTAEQAKGAVVEEDYVLGRVLRLAAVAALGGFLFGFDTAVINGAVNAVGDEFDLAPGPKGFVVASALLGCAVGAYLAGRLADRIGRIKVMVIAALMFLVCAIGSAFAFAAWDLTVWRIIGGLGVGAASVIAPAYIAETSPAVLRGRMGSLQQLAIVTGIFVALLSDALWAHIAGGASAELWWGMPAWRWMFLVGVVPAVLYGAMALTIPESPRHLMAKGQTEQAREVLRQVMRTGVDERIEEIHKTIVIDRRSSFSDIRRKGSGLLPIVWVGIALSVFQQFVGINVIFYYSSALWQQVGFTEADALKQTVITSVTNIVVTLVAIALVDRIGRKKLLVIGSAGMFVTLGTLAFVFATAPTKLNADGHMEPVLSSGGGMTALIAANLFVVFFGVSWGPVVWVLLGEMFNNKIRATALGVAAGAQWIANFAISTSFPKMADIGLGFAYGFYTVFALLSLLFVLKFVQETKGRQLEDMQ